MSIAHIEMILRNRRPHEVQAGVRYEVLERAVAEFRALAERICNCKAAPDFEISATPAPYLAMEQARVDRLHDTDAAMRGML